MTRWLVTLACLVVAVVSLGAKAGLATHITLLVPAVLMLWLSDVTWRPLRPCRFCDRGRDWDGQHEHYGRRCPGGALGIGACDGQGERFRWEARALVMVGQRRMLRNLPERMRARDE